MTYKETVWTALVAKHPQFGDPSAEITLRQPGLRRLFDKVFQAGVDSMIHKFDDDSVPTGHTRDEEASSAFMDLFSGPQRRKK